MPRGDKSKYTDKQKQQAEHIEEGYENQGVPESGAARRTWATITNKTEGARKLDQDGGRNKARDHIPGEQHL